MRSYMRLADAPGIVILKIERRKIFCRVASVSCRIFSTIKKIMRKNIPIFLHDPFIKKNTENYTIIISEAHVYECIHIRVKKGKVHNSRAKLVLYY